MKLPKLSALLQHIAVSVTSLIVIGGFIALFLTPRGEFNALAQTVNEDRCQAALAKLAQYEFMLTQSNEPPTDATMAVMAQLQQIIAESCKK